MRESLRSELGARCWLTLGALLPYWPLLSLGTLYVPDDTFTSDLWNGELPVRKLIGDLLARGELPTWTSMLCSGLPLAASPDPLGTGLFALLPLAAALDVLVLTLVLGAAHGTYALTRHYGVGRPGAVLAGLAFSASGYMAGQLRHLGIIGTVAWLPLALYLLDRGLGARPPAPSTAEAAPWPARAPWLVGFGLIFGLQVLAGFPQSAYICALCYGVFALFSVLTAEHPPGTRLSLRLMPLAAALCAVCLGAAMGAAALLPLAELGSVSDRAQGVSFEWASTRGYWLPNILTFFSPYLLGDISDDTYRGPSIFWEDYGYVGLCTVLLAIYASFVDRKRGITRMWIGVTVVAYLFVLGPATPLFRVAFEVIPGFKLFRSPTRFLIVVELGLCVLAAIGLTRLHERLAPRLSARAIQQVVIAIVVVTALDLSFHQPRQNPMVDADTWLAPPLTMQRLRAQTESTRELRVFTPFRMSLHTLAFKAARGWTDLRPYFFLRNLLEPNANLYWDVGAADCYVGIAPRWHIDVWGSHTRRPMLSLRTLAADFAGQSLRTGPRYAKLLAAYGVTHVVTPLRTPTLEPELPLAASTGEPDVHIYPIPDTRRARVVAAAVRMDDSKQIAARMLDASFDANATVFLSDAPPSVERHGSSAPHADARAWLERDGGHELVVHANAPQAGYLLLADTYFPGWHARVDGKPAPIYRANISVRAVPLTAGKHRVVFHYEATTYHRGLIVSALATLVLVGLLLLALRGARKPVSAT